MSGSLSFNNQNGTVQVDTGVLSLRGGTSTGGNYVAAAGTTLHLTAMQLRLGPAHTLGLVAVESS